MEQTNRELTLTRVFAAPRELVFKAWTDEKLLAQWWGPDGFTAPIAEIDARPGGKINVVMEDTAGLIAKGGRYPMTGQFDEVATPERLVFTASAIMNGQPILETKITVTFAEQDDKTTMTVHVVVTRATPEAEGSLAGMEAGWNQQLDKLVSFIARQ
jgi:uncharacterized protein YndB with AHSA1/START domain